MLRALRRIADAGLPLPLQLGVARGHVFAAEVGVADRAAYSAMGDTTNTAARIMSTAPPGVDPRPARRARALPHPVRGDAPRALPDEGQGRARARLRGRREDRAPARCVRQRPAAVPRPRRRARRRRRSRSSGPSPARAACSPSRVRPASARPGWPARRSTRPTRPASPSGSPCGPSPTAPRAPTGCCATRCASCSASPAAPATRWVQRCWPPSAATPPACCRWRRCSPTSCTSGCPTRPRPTGSTRSTAPTGSPTSSSSCSTASCPAASPSSSRTPTGPTAPRSHLLGRMASATAGRPWAVARRAARRRRWVRAGIRHPASCSTRCRPTSSSGSSSPPRRRPRCARTRSPPSSRRPTATRSSSRRSPASRSAPGSLDELPESVQAAMGAQVDELPPAGPTDPALLRRARPQRPARGARGHPRGRRPRPRRTRPSGCSAGSLEADGPDRLRFRNSLVRDAAYDGLAYRVRARIHRTAGEVLERLSTDLDADSPALVLHFARAGDAARTWDYAQRAGRLARALLRERRRRRPLRDRARREPPGARRHRRRPGPAVGARSGDLRELAGMFDESVEAYRNAARLLRADPVATAEVLSAPGGRPPAHRGVQHDAAGRHPGAAPHRGLRRAGGPGAPSCGWTTSPPWCASSRSGRRRPASGRCGPLAEAGGPVSTRPLVRALMLVDIAELQLGVPGLGERHRQALEICDRPRPALPGVEGALEPRAPRLLRGAAGPRPPSGTAPAATVALEAGSAFVAAETDVNLAELLINQGHLDEAEAMLVGAVRVLRASGAARFLAEGQMQLARVHLSRGDLHGAPSSARPTSVRAFADLGNPTSALEAALVRAEAVARQGRPEEALAIIDAAEHEARDEAAFSTPRHLPPARARPAGARPARRGRGDRGRRAGRGARAGAALRGGAPAPGRARRSTSGAAWPRRPSRPDARSQRPARGPRRRRRELLTGVSRPSPLHLRVAVDVDACR